MKRIERIKEKRPFVNSNSLYLQYENELKRFSVNKNF